MYLFGLFFFFGFKSTILGQNWKKGVGRYELIIIEFAGGDEASKSHNLITIFRVGSEPGGAAELLQVCWLEVSGKITCAEKGKKYNISFCISLKADAFGWNNCPVYVMAKFGKKGKYFWKKMMLTAPDQRESNIDLEIECKDDNEENKTIYFGLYEVWSGKWKGGLLLHKAIVKQV